jgi:hypothetical protein
VLKNELNRKFFSELTANTSINYIKGFSVYERIKLEVELLLPDFTETIIISQHMAPKFKFWMTQA